MSLYVFPIETIARRDTPLKARGWHFAETTFNSTGARKFNVEINGKQVLSDFDVFQESGGKDKAMVKEFSGIAPDSNGNILIKFQSGLADKPEINAIEILN